MKENSWENGMSAPRPSSTEGNFEIAAIAMRSFNWRIEYVQEKI
jgi:hypothetical protein